MTVVYPVVFTQIDEGGYLAYVPDLQINTEGKNLADAIAMARDAIGVVGLDIEDDGDAFPVPSVNIPHQENEIVSLVDVDLAAYRRSVEHKTVRRNVSLPAWLNNAADVANLNVSAVLQAALKQQLGIQ
ncbi:type II toxin-antitoxin system HicB family antitoxin [uncultured Dysosmobacter sp.]|uniref:type II toxin-antitoxin system HicB family antitoxin n=1 Tax=uncultured Dysosmobacter sp. TaxID=2591384 RepID=UPI002604D536|nr:type II toxin-antitoxin system HicB family antitoxin [uncultured Dysosmobacter sp.]